MPVHFSIGGTFLASFPESEARYVVVTDVPSTFGCDHDLDTLFESSIFHGVLLPMAPPVIQYLTANRLTGKVPLRAVVRYPD